MWKNLSLIGSFFSLLVTTSYPCRALERLTLQAIFGGSLHEPAPSELRWAPDGRRLAFFLPEGDGERSLWVIDSGTGEKNRILPSAQLNEMAPAAEQATSNERERTRRTRYDIPSFLWSPDSKQLLLSSGGRLFLFDVTSRKSRLLAPSKSGIGDPKFSPDGKWVSFLYRHDIWLIPAAGGTEKQLTAGGSELLLHGDLDWVYEEEFDLRTGYHWSPDSRHIAFLELNERPIPGYPIVEQLSSEASVDVQRYPKAGDPNPKARVGLIDIETNHTVWMNRISEYIPRISWADSRNAAVQLLNRLQTELELVEVDPETGKSRRVLRESDQYWLDITDNLTFISGGRQFLWVSSRSGYSHIYLYSRSGELLSQVTSGDWVVFDIAGVDEKSGWIYFNSNKANVIGRDLFRIKFDGSGFERMTAEPGTHTIQMNASATAYVDTYSRLTRTPEISVTDIPSRKKFGLYRERVLQEFGFAAPEIKELKTPDGAVIRILIYKPADIQPNEKFPVLVYAYGMPGSPTIRDAWQGNRGLFHQFLVQQRFVVVQIDDRSSAVPGHMFEVAAYHNLGLVAARDHETAVRHLKLIPYVNGNEMAIWGWSGGGFTAAYHMTHTNLFKAGIAGAPVTDWRLYDSIYTERYMGSPVSDREAYERASCISAAPDLNGRLLIIHGTQDDNVHPQNTFQFIHALIEYQKQFDLMMYPGKTHGITGSAENTHLYTMIFEFLKRNLL
jgi:dipeptidyl-peptidase 4